jgi:hypothetical protein
MELLSVPSSHFFVFNILKSLSNILLLQTARSHFKPNEGKWVGVPFQ